MKWLSTVKWKTKGLEEKLRKALHADVFFSEDDTVAYSRRRLATEHSSAGIKPVQLAWIVLTAVKNWN